MVFLTLGILILSVTLLAIRTTFALSVRLFIFRYILLCIVLILQMVFIAVFIHVKKSLNMSKIVFHSLTEEDFELLTNLAFYLLSLKYKEIGIFSVPVCPVAFSPADMELFCKLKHSRVLLYDKK